MNPVRNDPVELCIGHARYLSFCLSSSGEVITLRLAEDFPERTGVDFESITEVFLELREESCLAEVLNFTDGDIPTLTVRLHRDPPVAF